MDFINRIFFKNLGFKLTSLALAFLLWLTFSVEQPFVKTINVHLEYRNVPQGMEISGPNPLVNSVEIHIRSRARRANMPEAAVAAYIDLKDAQEGEKVIHLTRENVRTPLGVEVLKINPARVMLILEKTIQKVVPIEPALEGQPASGYEVSRWTISPRASVVIAGPRSCVNKVVTAKTEPINIDAKNSTLVTSANVDIDDPSIRIQDIKPVQVTIEIHEKRKEMTIKNVPISVQPPVKTLYLNPKTLTLLVSVPVSFSETLRPEMFSATIKMEELHGESDIGKLIPSVGLKNGLTYDVKILSFSPTEVEVNSKSSKVRRAAKI